MEDVEEAIFSDRTVLTTSLLPALVEACQATPVVELGGAPVDLTAACDVLASWDGTYTLDARGAVVFREWLSRFTSDDRTDAGRLFSDGFDAADPVGTPSVPVDDRGEWLVELGSVVQLLGLLGIPVDTALGDVQHEVRTGDAIPIHGGTGVDGAANIVDCCSELTSTGPVPVNGDRVNDTSMLRQGGNGVGGAGYSISRGASFVMALQYGPDGPVAEGFLTYGNPDDPSDPAYRAGLEAFSVGEWRPFAFTSEDVAAINPGTEIEVSGERD